MRSHSRRYYGTGLIFGKMLCIIICVDYILLAFLDFFFPRENIDIAPKFELGRWQEACPVSRPSYVTVADLHRLQMCEEEADRTD